jgi:ABC-type glutathione transport system ATPase component
MRLKLPSRITVFLLGAAIGVVAAHLQGVAYVAAARENAERVFAAFEIAFTEEVQALPAGHQLSAGRAGRVAMAAALEESRARPFWSSLIGSERP